MSDYFQSLAFAIADHYELQSHGLSILLDANADDSNDGDVMHMRQVKDNSEFY